MSYIFNPFTGQLDNTGEDGAVAIGSPVAGGVPNQLIYTNSLGELANALIAWDGSTYMAVGSATLPSGLQKIIWYQGVTPIVQMGTDGSLGLGTPTIGTVFDGGSGGRGLQLSRGVQHERFFVGGTQTSGIEFGDTDNSEGATLIYSGFFTQNFELYIKNFGPTPALSVASTTGWMAVGNHTPGFKLDVRDARTDATTYIENSGVGGTGLYAAATAINATGLTSDVSGAGSVNLRLFSGSAATQTISISAPFDGGGNYDLVLPTSQGGAGHGLVNDGAGNLSWGSATGYATSQVVDVTGASYSVDADDAVLLVSRNGTVNVNLPDPAIRRTIWIKDTLGAARAANAITFVRFGAEMLEGTAADYVTIASYGSYNLVADGTNWWIL